ncbi:hypothetical protein BUALT_Bualt02G0096800 [Buddleja alternifolia]|uniref:Uncharacterized protein n=1 Tax=Buddleja alternifolia TaxID=168488 RepID=A0AAV6Y0I2_9LAMI|nr:hypothetical protein BUALT_Bualt02G0096800 [Buddleja alternifolia]
MSKWPFIVYLSPSKNCVVKHDFTRSGYTISAHFNNMLTALLKLHKLFLVKPVPIEEDCTNYRWKWFKGSAANNRVLKDAITRANDFRISDEMPYDPLKAEIPEVDDQISSDNDVGFIDQVQPSQ